MKSFLKIFQKGKDKWQYGNTRERANSDTYETFHENESEKARSAWNSAAAMSYLTILEAIHHKMATEKSSFSNNIHGFETERIVEAFLVSQVDKNYVETFNANVLFSAAIQILDVTEALLEDLNCEALLRAARMSVTKEDKYQKEIVSNLSPHSLQVLGALLSFSEIMVRSDSSHGYILADKLAVKLLPLFSNRRKDLSDAFPYLMGHYREFFPFGQQFTARLVGASAVPEEVTVQEWAHFSKPKTENTDPASAPESPSFSGVRDSTKVVLNRVDSSVDFATKPSVLSEGVPESKDNVLVPSSARLVSGIAASGTHSTDEAESKGVEYKDTMPSDEGIQYFKSDSDISDTDSKSSKNKKLTAAPQLQNHAGRRAPPVYDSNDFDDDSIEDIGIVEIKNNNTNNNNRPVISLDKAKLIDDSILSIPELEQSANHHEKESVNSWDEEEDEEEEKPAKQWQNERQAPPPIFSPPMLAKTANANKWKTEKMYTFDESDSDEGVVDAKASDGSDDINDIPSLSDTIGHGFASTVVEPKPKEKPASRDSKLFVLTTLDVSRDSDSAYGKEINRTFSIDEPEQPRTIKDGQRDTQIESRFNISQDSIVADIQGHTQSVSAVSVAQKSSEPASQAPSKVKFKDSAGQISLQEHKDIEKAPSLETALLGKGTAHLKADSDEKIITNKNTAAPILNTGLLKVPTPSDHDSNSKLSEKGTSSSLQKADDNITGNTIAPPTRLPDEPSQVSISTARGSDVLLRQSNTLTEGDETDSVRSDGTVTTKKKKKGIMGFMNKIKKTFTATRKSTDKYNDLPLLDSTSSLVVNNENKNLDTGIAMREATSQGIQIEEETPSSTLQEPARDTISNNTVAEKSISSPSTALTQALPLPLPERGNTDTIAINEPTPTRAVDETITLLVHDETEKSIHELFDHLKRKDSSASMSSFDSNMSSKSLDHANEKKLESSKRLSNPALKSKSVFGNFKNMFRPSSTGKASSLQVKEVAEEPVKDPAIVSGDTPGQVTVVDSSGPGPGPRPAPVVAHEAANNRTEERSDYGDEMQSIASSVDSRSVNTATVANKFHANSSHPKNGIGLAKLLRKSNRPEEPSVEQTKPLALPIAASDAFASALLKVDHLTVLMHDIERARQELELENGPQTRVRAVEGLRDDIARVQKNRLRRLNAGASDSGRSDVIAMAAMDESAVRKMFDELRNGSASASTSSIGRPNMIGMNIEAGLNYIHSLSKTSDVSEIKGTRKDNEGNKGIVKAHDIATVVVEPLYGLFAAGIALPKHIADAPYAVRNMSKLAEEFPSVKMEANCPFQMTSEWEIACGIHFSGELVKRLPRGNLRRRYFILVASPESNPNLTVDSFGTRAAASTTKNESIRDIARRKYRTKLPRDYFLMEYSSCTVSSWGKVPIGLKRCYPLKNLMSVQTKTDAHSKGIDFKFIFQAQPPETTTAITKKEEVVPGPSKEQLQLDEYKTVLQKNIEVEKIESERARVLERERKKNMPPPPEAVHLQSYMNILRKNVSPNNVRNSNLTATTAAAGANPTAGEEGDEDGSAENKSGSGDSFDQEVHREFSDIANSLNDDGFSRSYVVEEEGGGDGGEFDYEEELEAEENAHDDESEEEYENIDIDNRPAGDGVASKDQQAALLNAQREIHKILSQPINRKGNKDITSLALRALYPDSRMKWVTAIQAVARSEVYLNTLNY